MDVAVGALDAGPAAAGDGAGRSRRSTTPPASRCRSRSTRRTPSGCSPARATRSPSCSRSPTTASRCRTSRCRPSVRATVTVETTTVESQNVVGLLRAAIRRCATNTSCSRRTSITSASAARSTATAIYNGAMDNASGIATLIETAAALARAPQKPKRSVLFVAVTAEEKGLLGSRYFATHPTVPPRADRRQHQHGHVPAALPAEERDGARPRRVGPRRRRARGRGRDGPRRAGRSGAAAQPLHPQRSVQLHPRRACPRWR